MNTIYAGFNSWKTTLVGCLLAALTVIQEMTRDGIQWDDPQLWVAVCLAVLGLLSRDANKSSQDAGIR